MTGGEPSVGPLQARRLPLVVVAIVAILASAVASRTAMNHRRTTLDIAAGAGSGAGVSLSNMNSYALALLLGGLRGPLVMFLWPSSEMQKSERNLQDFDTKIEWIRLLQAEFDTVHIFQIWNKAYNISVQMANVGNKYATILDALDYAYKVDRERPNNINILAAIGQVYFDKLGNSAERAYYKSRIRSESLPHELRQKLRPEDPGWRRLELDAILDEQGYVLEQYLRPGTLRLEDKEKGLVYDGSRYQFLPEFGPYKYGLSPFGLGYSYYKRAQLLQNLGNQRHRQLSELVIDSRPALSLKNWAEDEQQHGRRMEIAAVGAQIPLLPDDTENLDRPTQNMPAVQSVTSEQAAKFEEAIFSYDLAVRLIDAADAEYERHVTRYPTNLSLYRQHRDSLSGVQHMSAGDRDFLRSILAGDSPEAARLRQSSADAYARSIDAYAVVILRYYVPQEFAAANFPPGVTRDAIDQAPRNVRQALVLAALEATRRGQFPYSQEDIQEYARYMFRAEARLEALEEAGARPSADSVARTPR